jgi:uncharacterized protein with HXXEE motif
MTTLTRPFSQAAVNFWSWVFPLTYLIHIAEEYWMGGGYPAYLYKLRGVHLSNTRFLVSQAVGVVLIFAGVIIARQLAFSRIMLVIFGAVVLTNALSHIITSSYYSSYGPGLLSSIFIWLPLGVFTLIRSFPGVRPGKYWMAVAIGVGINLIIAIFTMRGGRLG